MNSVLKYASRELSKACARTLVIRLIAILFYSTISSERKRYVSPLEGPFERRAVKKFARFFAAIEFHCGQLVLVPGKRNNMND